jgi:hypothetical protein
MQAAGVIFHHALHSKEIRINNELCKNGFLIKILIDNIDKL